MFRVNQLIYCQCRLGRSRWKDQRKLFSLLDIQQLDNSEMLDFDIKQSLEFTLKNCFERQDVY